jgi:hypothetical protein
MKACFVVGEGADQLKGCLGAYTGNSQSVEQTQSQKRCDGQRARAVRPTAPHDDSRAARLKRTTEIGSHQRNRRDAFPAKPGPCLGMALWRSHKARPHARGVHHTRSVCMRTCVRARAGPGVGEAAAGLQRPPRSAGAAAAAAAVSAAAGQREPAKGRGRGGQRREAHTRGWASGWGEHAHAHVCTHASGYMLAATARRVGEGTAEWHKGSRPNHMQTTILAEGVVTAEEAVRLQTPPPPAQTRARAWGWCRRRWGSGLR